MPDVVTVEGLYGVDPAEFVRARDALVRHLRRQGERDAAAEVAALRRPTPSVWALNSLARAQPERLEQVLAAAMDVRDSVPDGGDPLRAAQSAYRQVVDDAASSAAGLAGVEGAAHLARMRDTLLAAGSDPEVAAELGAGTLRVDHDPPGFALGVGGGAVIERGRSRRPRPAATPKDTATPKGTATPKDTATTTDRVAVRREQRAAQSRERERSRLVDRLDELTHQAEDLDAAADEAEALADAARRAAVEAHDRAQQAAERLDRFDRRAPVD